MIKKVLLWLFLLCFCFTGTAFAEKKETNEVKKTYSEKMKSLQSEKEKLDTRAKELQAKTGRLSSKEQSELNNIHSKQQSLTSKMASYAAYEYTQKGNKAAKADYDVHASAVQENINQSVEKAKVRKDVAKNNFTQAQSCRPNCTIEQNATIEELWSKLSKENMNFQRKLSEQIQATKQALAVAKEEWDTEKVKQLEKNIKEVKEKLEDIQSEYNKTVSQTNEAHKARCAITKSCLDTPDFMFTVGDFAPGGSFSNKWGAKKWTTFVERINWFLGNIIQKLILAIWVIAVFIMTIWGGYMILNSGQDELVNKGKNMFITGIYAVVIALGSYILISLVRFLIYSLG